MYNFTIQSVQILRSMVYKSAVFKRRKHELRKTIIATLFFAPVEETKKVKVCKCTMSRGCIVIVCVCAYARGTCERKLAKGVRESKENKCERKTRRRERKQSEIREGVRGRENESEKERNLLKSQQLVAVEFRYRQRYFGVQCYRVNEPSNRDLFILKRELINKIKIKKKTIATRCLRCSKCLVP